MHLHTVSLSCIQNLNLNERRPKSESMKSITVTIWWNDMLRWSIPTHFSFETIFFLSLLDSQFLSFIWIVRFRWAEFVADDIQYLFAYKYIFDVIDKIRLYYESNDSKMSLINNYKFLFASIRVASISQWINWTQPITDTSV